ncbi:hypothetical protein K7432_018553 [Basidiobolus ranarum]|uniref:Uncharacterized protein n=1 Tax=Basidiobolus ranarum TaxID=34480 RepID=A0ABR2WC22_9FUNG
MLFKKHSKSKSKLASKPKPAGTKGKKLARTEDFIDVQSSNSLSTLEGINMLETNSSNDEALISLPDMFLSSSSASEEIVIPQIHSKSIAEQSSTETPSRPSTSKMATLPSIEQSSIENLDSIITTRELQEEHCKDLYAIISKNYKVALQAMTRDVVALEKYRLLEKICDDSLKELAGQVIISML